MLSFLRQALDTLGKRLFDPGQRTTGRIQQIPINPLSRLEASLVSSIPDLLIVMTRQGQIQTLNSGEGLKTLDLDKLLTQATTIYDVLPPEIAQERMRYVDRALRTGQLQQYEYSIPIDGDLRYEEAIISVCGSDTVLVIVRDITEKKVAIQHAELYRQVQQINTELAQLVQTRTQQLQRALQNEELLRSITRNIRESLDETHLLYTAAQSLGEGLGSTHVVIRQIDIVNRTSNWVFEYDPALGLRHRQITESIAPLQPVIDQLSQGQVVQCCILEQTLWPQEQDHTLLICPISDNEIFLGTLEVSKPSPELFTDTEIQLVQQVAAQCAIAIRQARLYEAAQAQVKELEKLNQLKDDFVATVSHELRTPMTNIKLAAKMLQLAIGSPDKQNHYLNTLEQECEREISLIDNLLDLQQLETGSKALSVESIPLQEWLQKLAGSFQERAQQQHQYLSTQVDPRLDIIYTDRLILERVLSELLTNACKYTPPHHQISLKAHGLEPDRVEFQILNTGVEIPPDHLPLLFQKFYRIPKADRWQQGGTGLGLSLVKRAIEGLGGEIEVESGSGQTLFTLWLPLVLSPEAPSPLAHGIRY